MAFSTPGSDKQQRINGVKGGRLDEHGDDGFVQSSETSGNPHGGPDVPVMQHESRNDQEREGDVE